MEKTHRKIIMLALAACALSLAAFALLFPSGPKRRPVEGYTPLRDDALAARYRPLIDCPPEFGPLLALYYRAAKDSGGLVHIAYHPLWAREVNNAPGFSPFLSRSLYTGGLSLQRLMYGKGDIESVALTLDPASGEIRRVDYETAESYSPSRFSVTHKAVGVAGPLALPVRFRVVSWNHLFSLEKDSPTPAARGDAEAPLQYFSSALWREYSMVKDPNTLLREDRAHFEWEEKAAE
jgi:hypothetical protein